MNNKRIGICFIVSIGILCLIFIGCGKKDAPIPRQITGEQVAPPFDVKYIHMDDHIRLSWKHETDPQKAFVKPISYDVFMSRKTFEDCQGCPFVFERIHVVPVPDRTVDVPVEKGYKYYFRIQATGKDDLKSDFSKTILFEYP